MRVYWALVAVVIRHRSEIPFWKLSGFTTFFHRSSKSRGFIRGSLTLFGEGRQSWFGAGGAGVGLSFGVPGSIQGIICFGICY